MRARSRRTFSSRFSARSPWTSDSAGFFCSLNITTKSWLELKQAKVLHLPSQITSLDREALDSLCGFVREAIELSGVDEHAQRQLFAVLFDHVLVAGNRPPCDFHLLEAADPAREYVDRASHSAARMLAEEGELLWFRRGFEDNAAPVGNALCGSESRHGFQRRLAQRLRQVGPGSISGLVAWNELGPVLAEHGHEMLAGPVLEVQHPCPQSGGAGGAGGFDHGLDAFRPVRKAREYRRHTHADVDPGRYELLNGAESLSRVGGARLGPPPDVVVDGRDADADVEVGTASQVGQNVDVADDHPAAGDHRSLIREMPQYLHALA